MRTVEASPYEGGTPPPTALRARRLHDGCVFLGHVWLYSIHNASISYLYISPLLFLRAYYVLMPSPTLMDRL